MSEAPLYPKRLIEVDLPIKRISTHARREKSIRHGHISTLHIWWARRPLAACRAVICAALWPDPGDLLCPRTFLDKARAEMLAWTSHDRQKLLSDESRRRFEAARKKPALFDQPDYLRMALLDFIADFSNWDNSVVVEYLNTSRALTQSAHEALGGSGSTRPLVIDPFAGGGSIPLEALRVGADAFASDLNPVAVLLDKVMLEYVPRYGRRLADEVRKWGQWIEHTAAKELAQLYPKDSDGASPIAYLWARMFRCEGPGCGAEVPLVRSFLLAKRARKAIGLNLSVSQAAKTVSYAIDEAKTPAPFESGTLRRGAATCPVCRYTTPAPRVRQVVADRQGGADDARLLAVYCDSPKGRFYRDPTPQDAQVASKARRAAEELREQILDDGTSVVPNEELPYLRSIFNINLIGVHRWEQMFTSRQLVSLLTLGRLIRRCGPEMQGNDADFAAAVTTVLGLAADRQADYSSAICTWVQSGEFIGHTFAQGQSLPIKWDFAEVVPFASGSGNWEGAIDWVARVIEKTTDAGLHVGNVHRGSATAVPLPDDSVGVVVTDPPYYDAVPYADLSDFFYVWLKRNVGHLHPDLFKDPLTQKNGEIVQLAERNPKYAFKTREYFERLMCDALVECRRITAANGLAVIVFAHKETSAWETMLQAVMSAGWVTVASWPIDTEMGARLRARNSAALASSIHLVCRPREPFDDSHHAAIGNWREILEALPRRIHEWMPRLAAEGVVGADAIFACLGPALEVFSKYSRVERANGESVMLREYLEHVWAAVSREALSMIFADPDTAGLDEDARVTAIWLWTIAAPVGVVTPSDREAEGQSEENPQSSHSVPAGFALEFDAARKIAQGLGARLDELVHVVEVRGAKARLLPVAERIKYLFGGSDGAPAPKPRSKKKPQRVLFEELEEVAEQQRWGEVGTPRAGSTVLDRVHQAMILFGTGRGEALRRFLVDEGVGRAAQFWKLAQALSALYPPGTDEKRWVDGVLSRKKSLGL